MVEYYIVEQWHGGTPNNEYRLGGGPNEDIVKNGRRVSPAGDGRNRVARYYASGGLRPGWYDLYEIDVKARDNACGYDKDFKQYWSIRTSTSNREGGKAPMGRNNEIRFGQHTKAWRDNGLAWDDNRWGYQILAMEAFGMDPNGNLQWTKGSFEGDVWEYQ